MENVDSGIYYTTPNSKFSHALEFIVKTIPFRALYPKIFQLFLGCSDKVLLSSLLCMVVELVFVGILGEFEKKKKKKIKILLMLLKIVKCTTPKKIEINFL